MAQPACVYPDGFFIFPVSVYRFFYLSASSIYFITSFSLCKASARPI